MNISLVNYINTPGFNINAYVRHNFVTKNTFSAFNQFMCLCVCVSVPGETDLLTYETFHFSRLRYNVYLPGERR